MSIEMLKSIEREAEALDRLQRQEGDAARQLQKVRKQNSGWVETWADMNSTWAGRNCRALEVLNGVLDELRYDILRIAELRLAASEREYKVKAAQRRAVLNACILPLPEEPSHDNQ